MFRHNGYQQLLITQVKQNLEYNRNGCLFQETFANPLLLSHFVNVIWMSVCVLLVTWRCGKQICTLFSCCPLRWECFPHRIWPNNIIGGQWGRSVPLPLASSTWWQQSLYWRSQLCEMLVDLTACATGLVSRRAQPQVCPSCLLKGPGWLAIPI